MQTLEPDPSQTASWHAPLKRRTVLTAFAVAAVQAGLASTLGWSPLALADGPDVDAQGFFTVSQVLTGYDDLDPLIAGRIARALIAQQPTMTASLANLSKLAALPANRDSAEALLAAAKAIIEGDAALAVVAAWFKGTVGHGQSAVLITYKDALMYRPVSDGLIVPTYCGNGPLWWTAPVPDASASIYGPRNAA
ncbi:dehydrogenase subunit [Pseudomonas sp. M47T1]|uniref:sugar dehydrogenase complex small subunit n=1 Tax=Pseudomonas sp. M47T1 TaxID=1179778 RepID=UPI000260898B|nr:sugar dehydrogenase complex small subunit [Pseudomonas sp. M47T1]EIK96293.1 dehydrogenase subunit [Pseudomonas sp. M47T1]